MRREETSDGDPQVMGRRAFAEEYEKIYRRLWLLAAGILGNRHDADDIVQQSAMIAYKQLAKFRVGTSLAAWMSEIVKRTAWNDRRKDSRRKTFSTDPVELEQHPGRPVASHSHVDDGLAAVAIEVDDDLLRVLRLIPEVPRCCLLLRVIEDLSYAEIGEMLGIPEGTAASHVYRSKAFARERLKSIPSSSANSFEGGRPG